MPIPDALNTRTDPGSTEPDPYKHYPFVAKSRTRSGTLDTLNPVRDESNKIINPHGTFVRVGNIAGGKGTVEITPSEIYEAYADTNEGPRRIEMNFTATGPMWNSTLVFTIPEDAVADLDDINSSVSSRQAGYLSVDNVGGSDIDYVAADRTVTVTLKEMDTGQGVEIIYYTDLPESAY